MTTPQSIEPELRVGYDCRAAQDLLQAHRFKFDSIAAVTEMRLWQARTMRREEERLVVQRQVVLSLFPSFIPNYRLTGGAGTGITSAAGRTKAGSSQAQEGTGLRDDGGHIGAHTGRQDEGPASPSDASIRCASFLL